MEVDFEIELLYITRDAERLIEFAGRTAYQSFGRITDTSYCDFIKMIIKAGHFSVLEHAYASFRLKNVSRSLTHQLVRHRLASFTQKSQRFVDESNFSFVVPESIKKNEKAYKMYVDFMDRVKDIYKGLIELGIKKEDARYVLPNATSTEIVITANLREWRHILYLRTHQKAQLEIRRVSIEILKILKKELPCVFFDFEIDDENFVASPKYIE